VSDTTEHVMQSVEIWCRLKTTRPFHAGAMWTQGRQTSGTQTKLYEIAKGPKP
jgi:hypothetical protein